MLSSDKKKCAVLLPRPLFPLTNGYSQKNYHMIQILAERYNLKVIVVSARELNAEECSFYREWGIEYQHFCITEKRSFLNAFLGLFGSKPLQIYYFYNRKIRQEIHTLVQDMDILVSELIRMSPYVVGLESKAVKVLDIVDSIGLHYQSAQNKTESWFWEMMYRIETSRLLSYEKKMIRFFDVSFFLNKGECEYWEDVGNVKLLPCGVKPELLSYSKSDKKYKKSVAFLGKMNYQPNVDAICWYIKNVHSVIGKEYALWVVGDTPHKRIVKLAAQYENVTVTGFIEDPYLIMNSVTAIIAPMLTGGGIQTKVLEGMALGKANILSTLASKPIVGAEDGKHFIIADKPEEYIQAIRYTSTHPEEVEVIGKNAKELIQKRYAWNVFGEQLIKGIEECLE